MCCANVLTGGACDQQRAASECSHEDHGGAGRPQECFEGYPDEGSDPAAGLVDAVGGIAELFGSPGDLQEAENRQRHHRPAEHELERTGGAPLAQERDTHGDEHDRDGVAAQAEQPAGQRFDPPSQWPREVHVHRQPE